MPVPSGPGCLRGSGEVAPSASRAGCSGSLPDGVISSIELTRACSGRLLTRRPDPSAPGSAGPAGPPPGQFVRMRAAGSGLRRVRGLVSLLSGQVSQGPVDFLPDAAQRDAEHALPTLQQVHHLVGGGALVNTDPVAHQSDLGQV